MPPFQPLSFSAVGRFPLARHVRGGRDIFCEPRVTASSDTWYVVGKRARIVNKRIALP
jgi:hypothetical protein